jgi:hypothetical protein
MTDHDDPAGVPASRTAPPAGTPLFDLREAAAALPADDEDDVVDLLVPRWQNQLAVHVRYHRIPHRVFKRLIDVPEKKRKQDPHGWDLTAAADVLIEACAGIFVVHDDAEYAFSTDDPHGDWPTFGDIDRLSAELGKPLHSAREAVKAIFLADPDILTASSAYAAAMGYDDSDLERIRGN